ncbi:MAG: hypothetical protein ACLFS5_02550 [Spirochaetaceae bacterium]
MRKFLVGLFILLIAAGAVFYIGWVQIRIPAGSYGVVFTKTGDWDETVIRPGEFHWRWERLLPTNFTLHVFPATAHRVDLRSSGTLPSAEVYAEYLEDSPDFGYQIDLTVAYRIRASELPRLAREQGLRPADLEEWYDDYDDRITDQARGLVREVYTEAQEESPGRIHLASLEKELTDAFAEEFSDLEFLQVVPTRVSVPDFDLYEAGRSLYFETVEARRAAIAEDALEAEERRITEESRLGTLKRYGELLSEFPVLLDYFSMSAEQGVDPLALRSLWNQELPVPEAEESE